MLNLTVKLHLKKLQFTKKESGNCRIGTETGPAVCGFKPLSKPFSTRFDRGLDFWNRGTDDSER